MTSSRPASAFSRLVGALFGRAPRATDITAPDARPSGTRAPSVGQEGPDATEEIDARGLRGVRPSYAPTADGEPDPGEVVWTWVPYEEHDGRGKDRPVVIIAADTDGTYLALQLTSKPHATRDYLSIGAGPWDARGRPSWVILDRVFRVHTNGVRREASSLDPARYGRVVDALRERYGWR